MKKTLVVVLWAVALVSGPARAAEYLSGIEWKEPKVIDPGKPGGPPSDAVVLFDGTDLSQWKGVEKWTIKDGALVAGPGEAESKAVFGDCQVHLEFASATVITGSGQGRSNSGVFLMGRYELQVLDSYNNPTYFDGQCGAIYKQHPPLVNASRKPGEWQTYDIIWTRPRFCADKKLISPAYITVLHNGVLIQNHFALEGDTPFNRAPKYEAHPDKGPLRLQYHGNPVQFRNIWVREIKELESKRVAEPHITKNAGHAAAKPEKKTEPGSTKDAGPVAPKPQKKTEPGSTKDAGPVAPKPQKK